MNHTRTTRSLPSNTSLTKAYTSSPAWNILCTHSGGTSSSSNSPSSLEDSQLTDLFKREAAIETLFNPLSPPAAPAKIEVILETIQNLSPFTTNQFISLFLNSFITYLSTNNSQNPEILLKAIHILEQITFYHPIKDPAPYTKILELLNNWHPNLSKEIQLQINYLFINTKMRISAESPLHTELDRRLSSLTQSEDDAIEELLLDELPSAGFSSE